MNIIIHVPTDRKCVAYKVALKLVFEEFLNPDFEWQHVYSCKKYFEPPMNDSYKMKTNNGSNIKNQQP